MKVSASVGVAAPDGDADEPALAGVGARVVVLADGTGEAVTVTVLTGGRPAGSGAAGRDESRHAGECCSAEQLPGATRR
jgi:hypothetical protein